MCNPIIVINGSYLKEIYKLKNKVIIHFVFMNITKAYCCSISNGKGAFIPEYTLEDKCKEIAKFKALLRAKEVRF